MSYFTHRRAVHCLLLVLFAPTGTACTSWKHAELAPVPSSDSATLRTVRIVTRNGSQLTVQGGIGGGGRRRSG